MSLIKFGNKLIMSNSHYVGGVKKSLSTVKNGLLYNWYIAGDGDFAPDDWKVPTRLEFETLVKASNGGETLGGGGPLKEAGFDNWASPNSGATNSSGMTILPTGMRGRVAGDFVHMNNFFYMWTADNATVNSNFSQVISYTSSNITGSNPWYPTGLAIRLLYTGTGEPESLTDYDGNVYDVIKVGTQYWIKQNWACTHLKTGVVIPEITSDSGWIGDTSGALCAYNNVWDNV